MRSYPRNSPQAAGRLLGLVLIADGHVCRSEIEGLKRLGAAQALGLQPEELSALVQTLCEDLLAGMEAGGLLGSGIDDDTLGSLLAEIDDPGLQARVLALAEEVAVADGHAADGEATILAAARRRWRHAAHVPVPA